MFQGRYAIILPLSGMSLDMPTSRVPLHRESVFKVLLLIPQVKERGLLESHLRRTSWDSQGSKRGGRLRTQKR